MARRRTYKKSSGRRTTTKKPLTKRQFMSLPKAARTKLSRALRRR
ncbi:hypothetical protein [Flagellimonas sp.]